MSEQRSHAGKWLAILLGGCALAVFSPRLVMLWRSLTEPARPASPRQVVQAPVEVPHPAATVESEFAGERESQAIAAESEVAAEPALAAPCAAVEEPATPRLDEPAAASEEPGPALNASSPMLDAPVPAVVVDEPPQVAPPQLLAPLDAAPAPWFSPEALLKYLEAARRVPGCEAWAEQTIAQVHALAALPGGLHAAQARLAALRRQLAAADQLVEALPEEAMRVSVRRAQHALTRRLAIWEPAAALPAADEASVQVSLDYESLDAALRAADEWSRLSRFGPAWKDYLGLSRLQRTLEQVRADGGHEEFLQAARESLVALESPRLTSAQRKVVDEPEVRAVHRELRRMLRRPITAEDVLRQMERYEISGLPSDARELSELYQQWRWSAAPEEQALADELEKHYRARNVRLAVSQDLLERLLPAQKPLVERVSDTILGLPVSGQSRTLTELGVRVVPGSRTRLQLLARGVVRTNTTSRSGIVTAHSAGRAKFVARQDFELLPEGIRAGKVRVDVEATSELQDVETPLDGIPLLGPLVREMAYAQHDQLSEELNAEVKRKIAARARSRIAEQTDPVLKQLNQQFLTRILQPLSGMGLEPELFVASAAEKRFNVQGRLASPQQLAAHTPRPRALAHSVASLQVHQSAINNLLDRLELHGRRFTPAELYAHVSQKLGVRLAPPEPSEEEVYLQFAEENPLSVRMQDGKLELVIVLAELRVPEYRWRNLTICVDYAPRPQGPAYVLARSQPVRLMGHGITIKSRLIITGICSTIFPDDQSFPVLVAPLTSDPRLAGLELTHFIVEDGWLAFCIVPQSPQGMQHSDTARRPVQLGR